MLSDYLKLSSREDHDSIEGSIDLVKLASNPEHYLKLLKGMYGFYYKIEKDFLAFRKEFLDIGIDLNERLKLDLLKKDIKIFGTSEEEIESLPVCVKTPSMTNILEAMGVLYVLEGSTMGGQIIFKQLLKHKIISEDSAGGNFFRPYGNSTMPMWMKFKESLNVLDSQNDDLVLSKARETFNTMEAWLATTVK